MTESDFSTIISNNLEEVHMIAGSEQIFYYDTYNLAGTPISLEYATCNVLIFKYGNPNYIVANLSGSYIAGIPDKNRFSVIFSGSGLSGVYQQQVKIIDAHSHSHTPAQGKIVIFPSSESN